MPSGGRGLTFGKKEMDMFTEKRNRNKVEKDELR